MKTIRRFTSGIFASVDWLADRVENHEALTNAAIRDVEKAAARAKVQFNRVKSDGERIRKQIGDLVEQEEKWLSRAKEVGQSDKERAIECLRRTKSIKKQLASLREQDKIQYNAEQGLTRDLTAMEEQLAKLRNKRNILITRESRAKAVSSLGGEYVDIRNLDDLFDRWETNITAQEISADPHPHCPDSLEVEFAEEEESAELNAELDILLADNQ